VHPSITLVVFFSNLVHKILIYLHIIHLLKSLHVSSITLLIFKRSTS